MVAVTNLMAAGVHIILFTTGRGTPVGAPVPTVKIATNHSLAVRKPEWIDFDASPVLDGNPLTDEILEYVISVANGKQTKNEIHDYREISIFKDGVTL
jgi:altronate hydrolase